MTASDHIGAGNTFVDAHVHIHDCFDPGTFLDAAFDNFRLAARENDLSWPCPSLLMLTESANWNYFAWLKERAGNEHESEGLSLDDWRIRLTDEEASLRAERPDGASLLIIAGRQVVTGEGLEVLALATADCFPDGEAIRETLRAVSQAGGVPVIPWGFGKWSGRRGRILNTLIREPDLPGFCLGDNSGRLRLLPEPEEFAFARHSDIKILPGTDPLPFRSQQDRAGAYGFWFRRTVSEARPASHLKALLAEVDIHPFGRGEGLMRFGINQVAMQVVKRFRRHSAHTRHGISAGSR